MKKSQIKKIAESIGTSTAAVSKAINHCSGIGNDLREQILSVAEEQGVNGKRIHSCDVYVILPDIPAFFWEPVRNTLFRALEAHELTLKCNVYSKLGDSSVVEHYLDEAEELNVPVIIVTAKYEGLEERLSRLSYNGKAIFCFLENTPAKNVFFIGPDKYEDGRLLAEHCLADLPNAREFLILGNDRERLRGFADRAQGIHLRTLVSSVQSTAAEIAREIDQIYRVSPFDAVVCMDGTTAKYCMALKKCKLSPPVYGCEDAPVDDRYVLPVGNICQSIEKSTEMIAYLAEKYVQTRTLPSSKYTYIPSDYRRRD